MKNTAIFTYGLVVALSLPSCIPATEEVKLVGTWQLDAAIVKMDITFLEDHRYVANAKGLMMGSETGSWKIEGDHLITVTQTSTIDKTDIGKEDTDKIIRMDESVLILQTTDDYGKEEIITLTRLR